MDKVVDGKIPNIIERYFSQTFSLDTKGCEKHDQYVYLHTNRLCVTGLAETHPVVQKCGIIQADRCLLGKPNPKCEELGKRKREGDNESEAKAKREKKTEENKQEAETKGEEVDGQEKETEKVKGEQPIYVVKVDFTAGNKDRSINEVKGKGKKGGRTMVAESRVCTVELSDGTSYPIFAGIKGKLLEVNENLKTNPSLIATKPYTDGYVAIISPKLEEYDKVTAHLTSLEKYRETRLLQQK